MPTRTAEARWEGTLKDGKGTMRFGSGAYEGQYSFASRFEEGTGTNPEELIGAAHAGCFSMALSSAITKAGHTPEHIATSAKVHLEKVGEAFSITRIELTTEGSIPGLSAEDFEGFAQGAKANCPVSRALTGVEISVTATLA
jgi:lipoyl-dependent peroxiredoxin